MSEFIGKEERGALFSLAMGAAMAADPSGTPQGRRYAECAMHLLKAAIGEPITLAEAQKLLESWTMLGTPLEDIFSEAIVAIKARRKLLGDAALGDAAS